MPILNSFFTSNNNIIVYITTKDIYKREIDYKKQNLEQNCVLQNLVKRETLTEVYYACQGMLLCRILRVHALVF